MTRGEFYRCYRAGRPGWSRRRAVALLWLRDGLALVGGIALILAIGFFASWVPTP